MTFDLWVDFQRMRNDGRLRAHLRNARPGFTPIANSYITVGNEDADPAVAKILMVSADGAIELLVLPGPLEEHRHLLSTVV